MSHLKQLEAFVAVATRGSLSAAARIEGVTPADVEQIIRYVRWLQREAGIY